VAALFQTLGTPTNSAIHKYVNQQKGRISSWRPAPRSGTTRSTSVDDGLPAQLPDRGPHHASTPQELPDAKIGILYQNDDYGKDYRKGLHDGLGEAAKKLIVMEQTYEVTDPTIDSQIVNLKNSGANVFFNVTIPKFAVQAIKKSHDIGWKPTTS